AEGVYRTTIRAKALDTLRGLLPAATTSNVGIYGTGQGYEQLLLRMRAHPLREVRVYADLMLVELRKVIPAFLKRVDVAERGGAGGLRRQAAQSASPAGPGIRADVVSLRRARRLRRVSRPAAPPAAHARVAAAHAAPRPRRARRDRRRGRGRRLEPRDGRIGEAARRDRGGRAPGGRVVRRGDGVSRALLHGDERPRGDARHRATDGAPGTSRLSPRLPADASAHRRAPSGHRRGDDLRGSLGGRARAAASRARRRAPAHCLSVLTMEDAR